MQGTQEHIFNVLGKPVDGKGPVVGEPYASNGQAEVYSPFLHRVGYEAGNLRDGVR